MLVEYCTNVSINKPHVLLSHIVAGHGYIYCSHNPSYWHQQALIRTLQNKAQGILKMSDKIENFITKMTDGSESREDLIHFQNEFKKYCSLRRSINLLK